MSRPPELAGAGANVADRAPAAGMAMERPTRAVLDVSDLPTVVYGTRALTTWGTMGFMVAEGMTLAILAASYLYLRRNFTQWPPAGTPLPDLLIPTANLVVLLLNVVAAKRWEKPATRMDVAGTRRWLGVGAVLSLAAAVLRWFELGATHTRWNSSAYGSALWLLLIVHGTLLVADFGETLVIALIFSRGRHEAKHFVDAADNAFYTYFMVAIWVPLYVLLYLYPRWS